MNTSNQTRREDERRIAERAAEWLRVLESAGAAERAAFADWLKESPRHVRELLLMTAWDRAFDRLDPQRRIDIEAFMAKAAANVVALPAELTLRRGDGGARRRSWRWEAGIAASLAAIALAFWWYASGGSGAQRYVTGVGEQRALELEDGSVVYLNTGSRVDVRFSVKARDLELVAGEALFKVSRDIARPFRVHTDSAVIQAIGTQFNVRRNPGRTTVAVIEGRVLAVGSNAQDSIRLAAGEEANIARGKPIAKLAKGDLDKAMAWRQRRLVFRKDTLADIAAEFNRYNRSPQIRVASPALRAKQFNGVFDADDPESLLKYLADDPVIAFDRRGDELVIHPRE